MYSQESAEMDFVYPLGVGSFCKNQEIKYSLRSLQYIAHNKIFIIGNLPCFLKNVIHVKFSEGNKKQTNVINKILHICDDARLSENFVLMNDDFFFLQQTEIKNYINKLTLEKLQLHTPTSQYGKALKNTIDYLQQKNLPQLNFEIHYPMIINKHKFKALFENFKLDREFNYRSIYGNTYSLQGQPVSDFKIHNINDFNENNVREFISIADRIIIYERFKCFLKDKFSDKCSYEL